MASVGGTLNGCSNLAALNRRVAATNAPALEKSRTLAYTRPMHFLRTLFWVVIAVFLAIMARNNWSDVTLNLWGSLQADIKIPFLILLAFLLGFLPTFIILRGRIWQLKRKLATQSRPVVSAVQVPAAPEPGTTEQLDPA